MDCHGSVGGVEVGRVDDDRAEGVVDGAVCGDARV